MENEFKYKTDIKNSHYEVNRINKTVKALMERQKELESDIAKLDFEKELKEIQLQNLYATNVIAEM